MKKQIIALSVMLASALSLTNCAKEELVPATPSEGTPFSLTASIAETKTANDGLKTAWVADDAINLFHAAAGTATYVNDGSFTVSDVETGKFDGTLAGTLTAESYDWYAIYPYTKQYLTPNGTSTGYFALGHNAGASITQDGNNSTAHLAGKSLPLYGEATVAVNGAIVLNMNNLASVVKINVTNTTEDPITVAEVKFTSTEDIVGTYCFDLTTNPVAYKASNDKYVSSTASLSVVNGAALAKGESAAFYIPVKPHTAPAGSQLNVTVNGFNKAITLPKDVEFVAGHIKPLTFNYDNIEKPLQSFTWDLSIDETSSASTTKIAWTNSFADMACNKASATTNANNYYPGTSGQNYTSTRFYRNSVFSVGPKSGFVISSCVFEATTDNYANAFSSSTWTNANTSVVGSTVTVTAVDPTLQMSAEIGATCGFTSVVVYYDEAVAREALPAPETVMAELAVSDPDVTNSIYVAWSKVAGAASYEVIATPAAGEAKSVIVEGGDSEETTITGLAYETEYTISVIAKPADLTRFKDSEAKVYEESVLTGKKPEGEFESISFSFSRSNTTDTVTSGYLLTTESVKSGTNGYYQDKSGTEGLSLLLTKSDDTALFTSSPSIITVKVKVGAGTTRNQLTNNVMAYLVDKDGKNITSTETIVTTKVETTNGKEYTVTIPNVDAAYGLRISHEKESNYNVRVYSISFTAD